MNRVDPIIFRNSLDIHRDTYTAVQDSYRKLCDFPNFSRKILVIFKTFQGNFYLHIHQRNSLKVSFMTKFRCRVGSISSFPMSIRYRILDHKLSAINNDARMWADAGVSRISRADTHFPQKLPFDLYLTFILIHFNVYRRSLNLFGHPSFN